LREEREIRYKSLDNDSPIVDVPHGPIYDSVVYKAVLCVLWSKASGMLVFRSFRVLSVVSEPPRSRGRVACRTCFSLPSSPHKENL